MVGSVTKKVSPNEQASHLAATYKIVSSLIHSSDLFFRLTAPEREEYKHIQFKMSRNKDEEADTSSSCLNLVAGVIQKNSNSISN